MMPEAALREALRHNVLHFLCSEGVLDNGLAERMVIYRSRLHANLKRNHQPMPALKWLRMLMNRIPDEDEHLILLHERNRGKPCAPPRSEAYL